MISTAIAKSDRNALVVDDDPLIRWAVTETLGDLGYRVTQAVDGHGAAAAMLGPEPFRFVLLDVNLPDCDDLSVLTRLRSLSPETPMIVMTAHGTEEMTRHALEIGAMTILNKPFELNDLADLVTGVRSCIST